MKFNARLFDISATAITERCIDAPDMALARQQLEHNGSTVLAITPAGRKKNQAFDLALFCQELRTLLSSGMSLVEAVDTLASRDAEENNSAILEQMKQSLLEGKTLSTALELNQFPFSPLLIASISASERTSRLGEALDEFIAYDKIGKELRKKIINALIYPMLIVGFGLIVSLFMISYVVPRFSKIYEDLTPTLSLSTRILMTLGRITEDNFIYLISGLSALAIVCIMNCLNGKFQRLLLGVSAKFFITRRYARMVQLARIYQTMAMLLKGGYSLVDAIQLAFNLAFEPGLHAQLIRAHCAISEGKRLSTAFSQHALTDTVSERLLQVGERSGNLPKILEIIAQRYHQEFALFVERMARLAEPVLMMAVGLMIGAIILMMYMPVFDLATGM